MGSEVDEKVSRLTELARKAGAAAVLISAQHNFAWLTAGRTNRIDGSREAGAGSLCVTGEGLRFLIANSIEMPRLRDEELVGLGFEPVEYPWPADKADPGLPARLARECSAASGTVLADIAIPDTIASEPAIARARLPLTDGEVGRYRGLGSDAGRVLGALCRTIRPGLTERQVARQAVEAMGSIGARAVVSLVAADERLSRYRHPVATEVEWRRELLVVICAERGGLVVALSRIICAGNVTRELSDKTSATARVFGKMVAATRAGRTGADVFAVAAEAYAAEGVPGEEARHHQGGAIGYRARDWVAHPNSQDRITPPQAFAWNPSITGSKVEETVLVGDTTESITTTVAWPAISLDEFVPGLSAPGVLEIS